MKQRIIEYPFHLGDLIGGTAHLDNFEFGAYMRLMLANIQANELPNDQEILRRFARCTEKQWAKFWPLIKDKFPETETGTLCNNRVQITIASIIHRSDTARANRLKNKGTDTTAVKRPLNGGPTNHITIEEDTNVSSSPHTPQGVVDVVQTDVQEKSSPDKIMYGDINFDQVFEYIWTKYPKTRDKGHKGKARAELIKALLKGGKHENDWRTRARDIAEGVGRYAKYCRGTGELNADALRWIRDDGYLRPWETTAGTGRSQGYSLETVHDQAMGDKTGRPEGREGRLERLGLGDNPGND
jgi:uncharacterized protein YdaU (DUF1376 family)